MTVPTVPTGSADRAAAAVPSSTPTGASAGALDGAPAAGSGAVRLSRRRKAALAVTSLLTLAMPVVWGLGTVVQLLTGVETDHRFHQVIGQGLLLSALWLTGLVPILVAGWRGRPPSPGAVAQHGVFVAAAALAGVLAPQSGGLGVGIVVLVTTGLLWWALPAPVPLRARMDALDPVAAPLALLASALLVPYGLTEAGIQHTSHDEHAQMAHYFDMALVALAAAGMMLAGAVLGRARPLLAGTGGLAVLALAAAVLRAKDAPSLLWCAGAAAIVAGVVALAAWRRWGDPRRIAASDGADTP
jgi:hypothetical protein